MKFNEYRVILTNGVSEHTYFQHCRNKNEAIILSQAEAIIMARGYDLVSVEEIK